MGVLCDALRPKLPCSLEAPGSAHAPLAGASGSEPDEGAVLGDKLTHTLTICCPRDLHLHCMSRPIVGETQIQVSGCSSFIHSTDIHCASPGMLGT